MTDPNQPPAEGDPFAPPPSGGDAVPPPPPPPGPTPPPPGIPGDVPPAPPAYGAPAPPPAAPGYGAMPPATPSYGYGGPVNVPNNMGLAIAALIAGLCCAGIFGLVTGIIAVVQASGVKGKAAVGDIAGAEEAARKARLFSLITFGIAVVGAILGVILFATGFFTPTTSTTGL